MLEIFNFITAYQKQLIAIIGIFFAILLSRHILKVHSFFICSQSSDNDKTIIKNPLSKSSKDKLIYNLLQERISLECTDDTYYCFDMDSNYKSYKYNKLIPEVISQLSPDKLIEFRTMWDHFRTLKLRRSSAKDLIPIIDNIIDFLNR